MSESARVVTVLAVMIVAIVVLSTALSWGWELWVGLALVALAGGVSLGLAQRRKGDNA
ncbi:MAG: hypothetical protein V7607_1220 [Solirubrobacteraceae bacterium]